MDAEEIARLVKDLRVSQGVRDRAVTITNEEVEKGQKRLDRAVVGKIFSRKVANRETLRSNLPRILRTRGSTEIEVVGHNLFVISFALESDKRVALEEGPWHFFQELMILKQTEAMQTPMEVEFKDISMWIQCHNVPLECMEPSIIKRIGGQVGTVDEVDVGEGGLCMGKYARVRVTRPIDEPLVRCVPLKQEGMNKEVIVIIQYERLPEFCFMCGRVGHISRDCNDTTVDKQAPRFDGWLRAGRSFIGRQNPVAGGCSPSRESSVRKLGFRETPGSSGGRRVERDKLVPVADGEQKNISDGEFGLRGAEGDGSSSEGNREMRMEEDLDVLPLGGDNDMQEGSMTSPGVSPRSRGGEEGVGSEGAEMAARKSKGNSPLNSKQRNGRKGGKGWKRLAREKQVEGVRSENVSGKEGKKGEGLKRREHDLEEDEGEIGTGHKQKQIKLRDVNMSVYETAVAASQPRRSL